MLQQNKTYTSKAESKALSKIIIQRDDQEGHQRLIDPFHNGKVVSTLAQKNILWRKNPPVNTRDFLAENAIKHVEMTTPVLAPNLKPRHAGLAVALPHEHGARALQVQRDGRAPADRGDDGVGAAVVDGLESAQGQQFVLHAEARASFMVAQRASSVQTEFILAHVVFTLPAPSTVDGVIKPR